MDFLDGEEEGLPEPVSGYYFENKKREPVCFSILPYLWSDGDDHVGIDKQVFISGFVDAGLRKIYKQVVAWKVKLKSPQPKMYVLTKGARWLWLSRPMANYKLVSRKILVTIQCLHYVRRTRGVTCKSLWDHIENAFSYFEIKPSSVDLWDHVQLIREFFRKDLGLKKSQLLLELLDNMEKKKYIQEELSNVKNPDFIDDDTDVAQGSGGEDKSHEEQDCFDSVCSICDNGGEILCCEGHCLRSFHAIKDIETESHCKTLGFTRAEVEAMPHFLCGNCLYKKHQCFHCGELGSSDKSNAQEVFACISATCGRVYHPQCVAKLLKPQNEAEAMEEESKILSGGPFLCPVHKCHICKQMENKKVKDLQFAICRRCPRSYHRKCLPREIRFESSDGVGPVRAWDNLLPNRILIFCLRHEMDNFLLTPSRDHIKFPEEWRIKKARLPSLGKPNDPRERMDEGLSQKQNVPRHSARMKASDSSKKPTGLAKSDKCFSLDKSMVVKNEKPKHKDLKKDKSTSGGTSVLSVKKSQPSSCLVEEAEKRITTLITRLPSYSLTLESFVKEKDIPSTHTYCAKHVDKTITLGKVEGSVEAIVTALKMIDKDNMSLEHAKAVCEPEILFQVLKWKNKLSVYLGPFLHGLLYTSFGRHFTKVDKLKEIVERLHWYVQSGDTIVDFCCGANDFSIIMKEKLEATKKQCFYRNYDIIPPKNDFNFVKSDWMKVQSSDLADGSQLIMGLNPPFGVRGALANKFIDKALEFKPKLLILIVPKETQRLDAKRGIQYDLIWMDAKKLAGKSFYLPGTVDAGDRQLDQWNLDAPPLYLWSRPDWTERHMEIAKCQGHIDNEHLALESNIRHCRGGFRNGNKRILDGDDVVTTRVKDSNVDANINKRHKEIVGGGHLTIKEAYELSDMSISPTHSNPEKQFDLKTCEAFGTSSSVAPYHKTLENYDSFSCSTKGTIIPDESPRAFKYSSMHGRAQDTGYSYEGLSASVDFSRPLTRKVNHVGSCRTGEMHADNLGHGIRTDEISHAYGHSNVYVDPNSRSYSVQGRMPGEDIGTNLQTNVLPTALSSIQGSKYWGFLGSSSWPRSETG